MSGLTAQLMGQACRPRRARQWRQSLAVVRDRLVAEYGVPTLGNRRDPVQEIFFIALSARTADVQYRRTYRNLWAKFPTLEALAAARVADVARCVADGGLVNKRARQMRGIARRLLNDLGGRPGHRLRKMTATEAYSFLTGLPGLGPKSALCVMMYSLDFDVFPVDVHVQRILARLGAIPNGLKHYRAQALAPPLVPDGASKVLHIGLVVHGRQVCLPAAPRCGECVIGDLCRTGRKFLRSRGRSDGQPTDSTPAALGD